MSKFEDTVLAELPRRPYLPQDAEQERVFIRRGAGPRQMELVEIQEGELLGMEDGQLRSVKKPQVGTFVHVQEFAKSRWVITHELANTNVMTTLFDAEGNQFEADEIRVSANQVVVQLAEPAVGRAVLLFAAATESLSFGPDEATNLPEEILFVETVSENQELNEKALRESGQLFVGTGILGTNFVTAANEHVEVSVGVYRGKTAIASTDKEFEVELGELDGWSFALNAVLPDVNGGSVLTNFYRLDVTVESLELNESIVGSAVRSAGKYNVVYPATSTVLTHGSYTSDLSVFQIMQELDSSLFEGELSAASNGSVTGDFVITFTATPLAAFEEELEAVSAQVVVKVSEAA